MSDEALIPLGRATTARISSWMPRDWRNLVDDIDDRLARLPTRLNEYGYDGFGYDPQFVRNMMPVVSLIYRYYFRVDAHRLENVPEGRVLLIANHAGNTFAWDGMMLASALFFEGEPPRTVRGMAEYYLTTIPFFNILMLRSGSVVGTPSNCVHLLENEEAVMVFPEGQRGFVKTYRERYKLQRFGLGFMRLALETGTPIVPIGIVGSEEQSPGLANVRALGKLIGAPAFPITLTFPWLGVAGFVPLPVKFHLRFGEPMHFSGDPTDEDAAVEAKVERVKQAIRGLVADGLASRETWFT